MARPYAVRSHRALSAAAVACLLSLLGACAAAPPPVTPAAVEPVPAPGPVAATPAAAPQGFVEMHAATVIAAPDGGAAVILRDDLGLWILPLWIGDAEALSIHLRLERRQPPRPLTQDLLDQVIAALGARPVESRIDDVRNETFLGRIVLERADGTRLELDARPSDAIAMALGHAVPIYVAERVLLTSGLDAAEFPLPGELPAMPPPPPLSNDPEDGPQELEI